MVKVRIKFNADNKTNYRLLGVNLVYYVRSSAGNFIIDKRTIKDLEPGLNNIDVVELDIPSGEYTLYIAENFRYNYASKTIKI
ncbi:MAG: hypothetical protein QW197_03550 [Candidatus Aenigmatarchaeota archaeon]